MKIARKDAVVRKPDNSVAIEELFDGKNFSFDFVISRLNGKHATRVNHASDRVYFVLKGEATVAVNGESFQVERHDLVVIPKGAPHGVEGNAELIIITSPPFDLKNEEVVPG